MGWIATINHPKKGATASAGRSGRRRAPSRSTWQPPPPLRTTPGKWDSASACAARADGARGDLTVLPSAAADVGRAGGWLCFVVALGFVGIVAGPLPPSPATSCLGAARQRATPSLTRFLGVGLRVLNPCRAADVVAHGARYALGGGGANPAKKPNKLTQFSEQQVLSCKCQKVVTPSCGGTTHTDAWIFYGGAPVPGLESAQSYPFNQSGWPDSSPPPCRFDSTAVLTRCSPTRRASRTARARGPVSLQQ